MSRVRVRRFDPFALPLVAMGALAAAAAAQCSNPAISLSANVGTDGIVHASTRWDPDGAGPAAPVVVLAGDFRVAGTVAAIDIATFDPATGTWGALPGLPTTAASEVLALAVLPNGELVAGGALGLIGGVPTRNVMRWTGSSWATLGGGTNLTVRALLVDGGGGLVAAGSFSEAGGVLASRIARFDGTSWSPLAGGLAGTVNTLVLASNGDVLAAGGNLTTGTSANIARWNGSAWAAIGTAVGGSVFALLDDPAGLIVVGDFAEAGGPGGPARLATWNGSAWLPPAVPLPLAGLNASLRCVRRASNGDLIVAGDALAAQPTLRFDGVAWSSGQAQSPSAGDFDVRTLIELPGGALLAGGEFVGNDALPVRNLVRVSPTLGSTPLQNGLPLVARRVVVHSSGDLYVGCAAQPGYSSVWRRHAGAWAPVLTGPTQTIDALVELPNGDVVAGGQGFQTPFLSRWNGSTWTSLGAVNGGVRALLVESNGTLLAGGVFNSIGGVTAEGLARWNGSAWSAVSGWIGPAIALLQLPSGELVVAGPGRVFRSSGGAWLPLGFGMGEVRDLALLANGTLVAGGSFVDAGGALANRVARWNGTIWQPFGSGLNAPVEALMPLPNGELIVGGSFFTAGGLPATGFARWNGAAWAAFGPGSAQVADLAMAQNGDVVVAGAFVSLGAEAAQAVARFTTTCPATAVASGAGCTGSGGANTLVAQSLPWLGSTFRSVANGLVASSLAVHVLGAAPVSVPLPVILPQASAGCVLQASPDALAVVPTNAGTAAIALPLPNLSGLLGLVLHQQVVALELDPFANVVGASAGNTLLLTLGSF
jgi:hypothetical protein